MFLYNGISGTKWESAFGAELCTMRTVCTADTVNCELLVSFIQILTLWPIPHICCLSWTFRRMNFAIEGLCILCLGALNESPMGHYRKALTLPQISYLCLWCDLLSLLISEQRFSLSRSLTCVISLSPHLIIQNIPPHCILCMYQINLDMICVYVNNAPCDLLGYTQVREL